MNYQAVVVDAKPLCMVYEALCVLVKMNVIDIPPSVLLINIFLYDYWSLIATAANT